MSIHTVWGPPQSGKTTLSIDLAYALSARGQSVCLISAERYGELSARMGIHIPQEKSLAAVRTTKESLKHIVYPAAELLYVLAYPVDTDAFGEELPSEAAKQMLEQANTIFDTVIVDCGASCNSPLSAWAMAMADAVVMPTGSCVGAGSWHKAYARAEKALEKKLLPICIEASDSFDYASLHRLINRKVEVWLPFMPNAAQIQMERNTLYGAGKRVGRKYSSGMDTLCQKLKRGEGAT